MRTLYLSVDPAQRGWIERDTYIPAISVGDVVRCMGVGRVVASQNPLFACGDLVQGMVGWQDYAVLKGEGLLGPQKLPPGVPIPMLLSVFGITGLSAYFGLLHVGRPNSGETVVVSGAAGATGMVVGQIAKIKGCRVVGVAGSREKCRWLVEDLGFDGAIDYKSEAIAARLAELCPGGIDVFFDNVGGATLDAALRRLALHGRVVLCGAMSGYEDLDAMAGPGSYHYLIAQRARMEGFIVTDFAERFGEAFEAIGGWVSTGKLKSRVDVVEGLENAPAALQRLFTGANIGKQLVKVAE